MRGKQRIVAVVLLAIALLVTACGTSPAPAAKPAETKPAAAPAAPAQPAAKAPAAPAAPAPAKPGANWPKSLQIASAAQGGGFHALATTLAPVWEKDTGVPVIVSVSKGSTENIALIDRGEVSLSMVTGSMLYESWAGMGQFKQKYQKGQLLFVFYPSYAFLYTRADSGITKMSDLKGKRVGIGPGSATWDYFIKPLIESHGLDFKNDIKAVYADWTDMATQVGDGTLHASAALDTTPAPFQMAEEKPIRVIQNDEAALDKAVKDTWYYFKGKVAKQYMPKGFADAEYSTIGWTGPYMVAQKTMPDDLAYALVKSVHTNVKKLAADNNLYRYVAADPKQFTIMNRDMEWHPGAIKYWKEVGLWQGK